MEVLPHKTKLLAILSGAKGLLLSLGLAACVATGASSHKIGASSPATHSFEAISLLGAAEAELSRR